MAGLGVTTAGTAAAQDSGEPAYGDWFSNVDNYDGTVDQRGSDQVTITVGTSGNGGEFGFGPAAVHVDPGTTIVWEWTGNGGSHNVVAEDGSFESELISEAGHTFEYTVDGEGIITYACSPHKTLGMKGAIAVGDVETASAETASEEPEQDSGEEIDYGGWFEGVNNFDGTVDKTGTDEVTVTVGADGNNGPYAFDPPAVRVDPGTTVVWEWSGDGGSHNVVDNDGGFQSDLVGDGGATFERTFEERGIVKYVCTPHESMGMRGAVVVGSPESDAGYSRGDLLTLGGGVGLAGGLVALFGFGTSTRDSQSTN
jgi:halocyanin-like protein